VTGSPHGTSAHHQSSIASDWISLPSQVVVDNPSSRHIAQVFKPTVVTSPRRHSNVNSIGMFKSLKTYQDLAIPRVASYKPVPVSNRSSLSRHQGPVLDIKYTHMCVHAASSVSSLLFQVSLSTAFSSLQVISLKPVPTSLSSISLK